MRVTSGPFTVLLGLTTLLLSVAAVPAPEAVAAADADLQKQHHHHHHKSNKKHKDDIPNGAFAFKSKAAKAYHVGRHIPTVPFKVPESWAGLLSVTPDLTDKARALFFWAYPAATKKASDNVIFWFNGGPGCSSLEGMLQELGPYLFPFNVTGQPKAPYVTPNAYSWHKLGTLIAVEQPLTTGFSTGSVNATGEEDIARDFYGFLKNLYTVFPELKGKKVWLTGESYAGKYIPYLAHEVYSHEAENKKLGINLKGIAINDPSFAPDFLTEEAPAIPFAKAFQKEMLLSDEFIKKLDEDAAKHNFTDFLKKHLVYPAPKQGFQEPAAFLEDPEYSPFNSVYNEAVAKNKDFNIYNVAASQHTDDPLGYPPADLEASPKNIVNDIPGLKALIHAPNRTWLECTSGPVFVGGKDNSPAPDRSVLPGVIEKSVRTVIQHGNQDYVLMSLGSQLAIQNMTWGGVRGYTKKPSARFMVDGKHAGTYHVERKLAFIEVLGSGHMIPQDQPARSFKATQYVVGDISLEELGR